MITGQYELNNIPQVNMIITNDIIAGMLPSQDFNNAYLTYYTDQEHPISEFLKLDKITYNHKIFVMAKIINKLQALVWAVRCAESVINVYESVHPDDLQVKQALVYMKSLSISKPLTAEQINKLILQRTTTLESFNVANAAYIACASAASSTASLAYSATTTKTVSSDSILEMCKATLAYTSKAIETGRATAACAAVEAILAAACETEYSKREAILTCVDSTYASLTAAVNIEEQSNLQLEYLLNSIVDAK